MKRALLLIALVLVACHREPSTTSGAVVSGDKPDIILITIDTLRADSVGYAGNGKVKTPFLDRIAAEGVVFTNAHAHNVVTLPSHTNILTGLYPYQHGIHDNAGFKLDPKFHTVATMLKPAGYTTAAFVAAFPLDSRFGLNQGFDVYDDNYGKGAAALDFVMQERNAEAVTAPAVKWWNENAGKKRFMWVHVYDPHAPYHPPEPWATQYASDLYLGEIAYADDVLGKTIGPLLAANPNTLLIITADHGEGRGDHGELTHGLFAYEPTLKIPLLVREPNPKHRVEAAYVRHVDIVPTILDRAGVAKPAELHGVSLLRGGEARDSYFESLSANLNRGWAPLTGVIHNGEKYIDLPIAELYDLPRDPGETKNLREEQRREVEASRKLLATFLSGATTTSPRKISSEEAAQLRSLGYITGAGSAKKTYTAADDPKNLLDLDRMQHEAIFAYQEGHLDQALALARKVVARRPEMASGRELLAFMLQQSERTGEAIENLRAAMATASESESVRRQLGLLLTEAGRLDEAQKVLAPLATSNDPDALNAYGIALADQGKLDDAARTFEGILQRDPNNAPALQNLGIVALRRDDVQSAASYLTRALALNPRLPLALNTLGVVYARQNDFARAVESWNRAVDIDPRQYDALFNIGLVEGRAGHTAEARAALERFVNTAPPERYASDIATARQALHSLK